MPMEKRPDRDKSYQFAVALTRHLLRYQREQREYLISRQCLRAGTSIGANIAEADAAQSRKDFIAKMAVASKEARETCYWLRLMRDTDMSGQDTANSLLDACGELVRLLTAIVKTAQSTIQH